MMFQTALKKLILEEVNKNLKLLTEGIVHLDKMKPKELLDFLSNWNLDNAKFHVSEKMDGVYMALGVENGQFYMRSKSKVFRSEEDVPSIFFMNDFRRYYEMLSNIQWNEILYSLSQKYDFNFDGTFEIEGEAIPAFDHNIVIYDEAKIGDGVFVIFNTKTTFGKEKEGQVHIPQMWEELATELNKQSKVKFFSVPEVSLSDLEFDNSLIIDLRELIETHGNVLAKPARKPAAKELKAKLLQKVAEIGMSAKQQALQHSVQSKFGPEVEGVVIKSPDGKLVKIVDTEKFTKRKELNWYFINQLISAERDFKKRLKENPEHLDLHLKEWKNEVENIQKDFDKNAHEYLTIEKKYEDTQNGIDYALGLINVMQKRLENEDEPREIADDFLNRKILPENRFSLVESVDLSEGGGVFDEMNSVVPKTLLEPSIENAMTLADLEGLNFEVVGNKTKQFFGDIDIAIDSYELARHLGLPETEQNFWDDLSDHLSKSKVLKYSIIKGLKQFHILVPLIDSSGEHLKAFSPTGERKDDPALIQVDVFVGNIDWMKDVTSGSPEKSKYKASYRNLLLANIMSKVYWAEKGDEENEYYRYVLDFKNGLKRRKVRVTPPTGRQKKPQKETIDEEIITANPNDLAEILFGEGTTWEDINSFEKLFKMLLSNKFQFRKFVPAIIDEYKKDLEKRKLEVPEVLKNI